MIQQGDNLWNASDYKKKYQREATEEQLKNLMNAKTNSEEFEIDNLSDIDLLRYNKHILLMRLMKTDKNY